jgi:hypothetical protein
MGLAATYIVLDRMPCFDWVGAREVMDLDANATSPNNAASVAQVPNIDLSMRWISGPANYGPRWGASAGGP